MEQTFFKGQKHTITLPSSRKVIIRETNGEDDAMVSNMANAATGMNGHIFLANIIEDDLTLGRKPLVEDIMDWPVSDRYYLMFKQRIINQGDKLEYAYICQNEDCKSQANGEKPQAYEQDLKEFDGQLDDPLYKPKNNQQVKFYPEKLTKQIEFITSSQVKVRFNILTGKMEQNRLALTPDMTNKNTDLLLRGIEIFQGGAWVELKTFTNIPSRIMSEIRKKVYHTDPTFDPTVKFSCPVCGAPTNIPLMIIPTFYWPEEMI